jgi:hypothetical protein
MEVDYWLENSGVALLARDGATLPKSETDLVDANTPDDFKAKGVGYLPLLQAPDDLIKCFSAKEGMWTKPWCDHDLVTLLGGLSGQVHFKGAGSVQYGAEPTAAIGQVLAGGVKVSGDKCLVSGDKGLSSENGDGKSEVGDQRSEVGASVDDKVEGGGRGVVSEKDGEGRTEDGNRKSEVGGRTSEIGGQRLVVGASVPDGGFRERCERFETALDRFSKVMRP